FFKNLVKRVNKKAKAIENKEIIDKAEATPEEESTFKSEAIENSKAIEDKEIIDKIEAIPKEESIFKSKAI
ncbi:glycosyltransferase family 2 protein, partial [Clostridium botulinum]|nr:glycosyltransferase family 2 protein [Clostridium botulinum]NFH45633.1 glycosyltransferase family 2 protein [Clostridium botulinum]NFH88614.1 glycosyltransferase family 2 protein [Clostridium botulinum]NFJ77641.1 glycosyltransferase family 2 protein [Clostridium botulinum]NFP67259.1 glycosyltransferase family 2 protein [Clostridium botulinum]